jgi:hypothetical protein
MLASEQFRCWADWHVFRRLGGVWRGLKLFLAARQIMNVQALFHYQERGIALTASRLFIKRMVSPDSRIFSPTFKVWALKIIGDNRSAHPNNNGAESVIAQLPIAPHDALIHAMPELTRHRSLYAPDECWRVGGVFFRLGRRVFPAVPQGPLPNRTRELARTAIAKHRVHHEEAARTDRGRRLNMREAAN